MTFIVSPLPIMNLQSTAGCWRN